MNAASMDINDFRGKMDPEKLTELVVASQTVINIPTAKSVLEEMFKTGKQAADIIAQRGLSQISDSGEIEQIVNQVIDANPSAVGDYKAGKTQTLAFLVGQVMKATKGRANPTVVNQELKKRLEEV
jgi:aspartyl-tRNA(Asn)/glutamyl-tRNA(Gln) amidotransferase subunit B